MKGTDPKIKFHVEIKLFRFSSTLEKTKQISKHKYEDSNLSVFIVCTITKQHILFKSRLGHVMFLPAGKSSGILACVKIK